MRQAVSILIAALAFCGCKRVNHLAPAAYAAYLEDERNEMKRTVQYGGVIYTIQLATPEYVVSRELADQDPSPEAFSDRLNELEGYSFFYIAITTGQQAKMNDPAFAEQRDRYYMQAAASDIRLLSSDEELKPLAYHFEHNYGLSPYSRLVAAFKTGAPAEGLLQLIFNDRFHENYRVKASFDKKTIAQLPNLEIK